MIVLIGASVATRISRATDDSPPEAPAKTRKLESVPGEFIVRFKSDANAVLRTTKSISYVESAMAADGRQFAMQVERLDSGPELIEGLRLVRVPPDGVGDQLEGLRKRPDVIYAEPNYLRYPAKLPNDPRFSEMWGLKNTGQVVDSGGHPGKPGNDIRAEQAWDVTTGSKNIVVGIIDQGFDVNHEDLKDNVWTNPGEIAGNGIDDDGNGFVDDVNGWDFVHNDNTVFDYALPVYPPPDNYTADVDDHGTHVAGIIGASGNNGIGVVGVNWQVSLMSLKFIAGENGTSADLLRAFSYAKMMRQLWTSSGGAKGANIRVLNNSYGGGGFSQAELDAIRALSANGILFVAAAGNDGSNNDTFPVYPANYQSPNVISVAASNGGGTRASFSNSGAGTVQVTAPGEHILSTTPRNTYDFFSGTSMATPYVSGSAALVCAAFPNISMQTLRAKLLYSGFVASWQYNNTYPIQTGRSVDANSALQSVTSSDTSAPSAAGQFNITDSFDFPNVYLQWVAPGDDGTVGRVAAYEVRYSDEDLSDPAKFDLARPLPGPVPDDSGRFVSDQVKGLWRHPTGFIGVRAVDDAGNAGPISALPLSKTSAIADPYVVTESAAVPLSTGGTPLGLIADDSFKSYNLPFPIKFYSGSGSTVTVSSNGAIYFGFIPFSGNIETAPAVSVLNGYRMIAAAWDDLRTDRRPGDDVYVVQPDANRIIFRWQAVTYDTPISATQTRGENPVNFEVEFKSDGTITLRYGDGNQKMFPVVGLGGGSPEPYIVDSHTSEESSKDLTNAGTVTFTRRDSLPAPTPTPTPTPTPPPAGTDAIVISQIYTTGGSGNPAYQNGYVELFNRGTNTVNLNNWKFQFGSDTGGINFGISFSPAKAILIQPGQYFLLQVGLSGGGAPLPAPDQSTGQANTQVAGKILISRPAVPFLGGSSCPLPNSGISDFVGYGPNANCAEATAAPALTNTTALIRAGGGCTDTDNNANDFVVGPPNPHNSSSPFHPCGNPIDVPTLFVKQHYQDFLNRAADQSGLDFWTGQITNCGAQAPCIEAQRVSVSGAFFLSIEFQQTGYLVERMYKVAFGDAVGNSTFNGTHTLPVPTIKLSEFLADTQQIGAGVVVLQPGWETLLENNKRSYSLQFVQTTRFGDAFPMAMTPAQFVDKLNQNAGSVLSASERATAIALFNGAADSSNVTARAQALRQVAEDADLYNNESNRAFVLAQYFGYLRRNPYDAPEPTRDYTGYDFWLTKLTQYNGDFVAAEMVKAFISSSEYRQRFGS